jgi:hypothetical protein
MTNTYIEPKNILTTLATFLIKKKDLQRLVEIVEDFKKNSKEK